LPEAASVPAGDELPRPTEDLPEARVQSAGIVGIHREVGGSRLLVDEEDLLPCLAAVFRAEDAALRVGPPDVSLSGDVHQVRVGRMDPDPRDLPRIAQTHVGPRSAP